MQCHLYHKAASDRQQSKTIITQSAYTNYIHVHLQLPAQKNYPCSSTLNASKGFVDKSSWTHIPQSETKKSPGILPGLAHCMRHAWWTAGLNRLVQRGVHPHLNMFIWAPWLCNVASWHAACSPVLARTHPWLYPYTFEFNTVRTGVTSNLYMTIQYSSVYFWSQNKQAGRFIFALPVPM